MRTWWSDARLEDEGLVLEEHEPVRIQYYPTATC